MTTVELTTRQTDYIAGDLVTGKLIIDVPAIELAINGIYCSVVGIEKVRFGGSYVKASGKAGGEKKGSGSANELYESSNRVFFKRMLVRESCELSPGTHEFPFEIYLPCDIPGSTSYTTKSKGKKEKDLIDIDIAYSVRANLLSTFDLGATCSIRVWEKAPPSEAKMLSRCVLYEYPKVLKFPTESVVVSMRVPCTVFSPEDAISLQCSIANEHKTSLSELKLRLRQKIVAKKDDDAVATHVVTISSHKLKRFPPFTRGFLDINGLVIPEKIDLVCNSDSASISHFVELVATVPPALKSMVLLRFDISIVGPQGISQLKNDSIDLDGALALAAPADCTLLISAKPAKHIKDDLPFRRFRCFYIDVDNSERDKELVVDVQSSKPILMRIKRNSFPRILHHFDACQTNLKDGHYRVALSADTSPSIKTGRYFLTIWGNSLFHSSNISVSCELRKCLDRDYEIIPSSSSLNGFSESERFETYAFFGEDSTDIERNSGLDSRESTGSAAASSSSRSSSSSPSPVQREWRRKILYTLLDANNITNPLASSSSFDILLPSTVSQFLTPIQGLGLDLDLGGGLGGSQPVSPSLFSPYTSDTGNDPDDCDSFDWEEEIIDHSNVASPFLPIGSETIESNNDGFVDDAIVEIDLDDDVDVSRSRSRSLSEDSMSSVSLEST